METKKVKTLIEKLADFQEENVQILKTKSAYNDNYRYSPLDEILPIIQPFLQKHGIAFYHRTDWDSTSNQNYVTTTFFNREDVKDTVVCRTNINSQVPLAKMNEFMVIGSAITYFRRYHIVTTLGLTTEEDTDTGAKDRKKPGRSVDSAPAQVEKDYVLIFENQIKSGKDEKSIRQIFETYKKLMSGEQVTKIEVLISEKFNSKK